MVERPSSAPSPWLLACVLLLAGLCVYANSFTKSFVLDDDGWILNSPELPHPAAYLRGPMGTTRPVIGLSLVVNYQLGKLHPFGYHLLNVAVHLGAGLALFGVVRRTLLFQSMPDRIRHRAAPLAFAVVLLWLVHPLQTQSVTYIIQRCESIMALFFLLAVYCAVRALDGPRPRLWTLASVVFCLLSAGAKEVAAVTFLVVLAYDWVFVPGPFLPTIRKRWLLYLGLALAGISTQFLRQIVPSDIPTTAGFSFKGITPLTYLLTQAGVLLHYLRLVILPIGLTMDYIDWPLARSVGDWLPPGLVILALLGITVWGLWRRRWFGFVGAWFFLILAPTSSIVPIADVAFEHRMYLPIASVILLVVLALDATLSRLWATADSEKTRGVLKSTVLLLTAFVLATLSVVRNEDYRTAATMYTDNLRKRPANHRAHQNASIQYIHLDPERAIEGYEASLKFYPRHAFSLVQRGTCHFELGNLETAIADLRPNLSRFQPELASHRHLLGVCILMKGDLADAEAQFRRANELDPRTGRYPAFLALTLIDQNKLDEAKPYIADALRLDPNLPKTSNDNARLLALSKPFDSAPRTRRVRLEAVLTARLACLLTDHDNPEFLDTLAIAYAANEQFPDAVRTASRALDLARQQQPDLAPAIERRLTLFQQKKPYNRDTARPTLPRKP